MSSDADAAIERNETAALEALFAFAAEQNDLSRSFARRHGLHTTDSVAIVAIIRAEETGRPLTPARLADVIGLTGGATSILVNRLEEAGLVTRARGHSDRRMVTLHSTSAVHRIADAFFDPLREQLRHVLSAYSNQDLELVRRFALDLRDTTSSYLDGLDSMKPNPDPAS